MDFALKHIHQESVATLSKIRYIPIDDDDDGIDGGSATKRQKKCPPSEAAEGEEEKTAEQPTVSSESIDKMLIRAANKAAMDILQTPNPDSRLYPERVTPQTETIQPDQLVVIFESFDNLNFCYAKRGEIFSNRNGHFHHNDFIGKPYGCKIRSRNNQGYGFVYLLKPTPELWARSLKHRTQIVHELDASMIVFYLNLRPDMIVCESGTGSGALSHCILRTIAPAGHLYTYEFNQLRAETAKKEFAKNRVDHLVTVLHKDVCSPITTTSPNQTTAAATTATKQNKNDDGEEKEDAAAPISTTTAKRGGFDRPQASVDAIVLDLPQPWLAVPHAAYCLKPNSRIASYSPCVEQSQRTVETLNKYGFHSITTKEFRLKEFYVAEEEYEFGPKEKRPRPTHLMALSTSAAAGGGGGGGGGATAALSGDGDDTGAEADNERSEYETEGDQDMETAEQQTAMSKPSEKSGVAATTVPASVTNSTTTAAATTNATMKNVTTAAGGGGSTPKQRSKKVLVARPFSTMRGHTAFLTFATAGNKKHPDPNDAPAVS